jgi:hypothetical protein
MTTESIVGSVAEVLKGSQPKRTGEGLYRSKSGIGYFTNFACGDMWVTVSISGWTESVAPKEICEVISDPACVICRANPYFNRKGHRGFEATLQCEGHFYMLSVSGY